MLRLSNGSCLPKTLIAELLLEDTLEVNIKTSSNSGDLLKAFRLSSLCRDQAHVHHRELLSSTVNPVLGYALIRVLGRKKNFCTEETEEEGYLQIINIFKSAFGFRSI